MRSQIIQVSTLLALALGSAYIGSRIWPREVSKTTVAQTDINVWFSPKGGCTDAIVKAIGTSRKTLDVQAYGFTSPPILAAIKEAKGRNVKIRVVLDRSNWQPRYTGPTFLKNAGIPVWIDAKHAISHNKVILIDGHTLITGSFNFTNSAEKSNAENVLIIESPSLSPSMRLTSKPTLHIPKPMMVRRRASIRQMKTIKSL